MKAWYLIHTRPRQEALADANLQRQAFETYLRLYTPVAKRRGAWKAILEPLFPRYLFLRLDPYHQSVAPIRSTLGVTTLVTFRHRLTAVPDPVIATLHRNEDVHRGLQSPPRHEFHAGDSVAVTAGPFAGLQGIFQTPCGDPRVAILINVIGQATPAVLPSSSVALA